MSLFPNAGAKTILIVEDNSIIRGMVKSVLQDDGFTVLMANSAEEAMLIEVSFVGRIDLLLAEVLMPDMMGPDLARAMKARRPEMRVMMMTHYPDGRILFLNYGWYFVKKLMLSTVLAAKVREALEGDARDQGSEQFDSREA